MSEETEKTPGTQVAVRQRTPVADIIPIFDTARFEHYGRIAATIARSTLSPQTLREGTPEEAIANCIQVVEFADRAGYSPFAVAQCASVVHGKLMFEGKLVDAMLQTKLGIELNCYYTGERGSDDRRVYVTDATLTEEQFNSLAPGEYPFGIKMIDGSVGEWKTKERSGSVKTIWQGPQSDIQLGYRGKRTWARFYRPAVMLGVLTEDEVQDFGDRREVVDAPLLASEFDNAPKPPRRARKPAAGAPSDAAAEPEEASHARQEGAEDAEDAEFEDGALDERPTTQAADTPTGDAQPADERQDTSGSAAPASEVSQDQPASSTAPSAETQAPPDTAYTLASDEPGEDGKIPTYRDGVAFSRVKPDAKVRPAAFDRHAPEVEAEPEPEPEPEGEAAEFTDDDAPEDDAIAQAIAKIRTAPHYPAARQVEKTLQATDAWALATADQKKGIRLAKWVRYRELFAEGVEVVQPYEDFALMRIFIEFGATDGAAIDVEWGRFIRHAAYKDASEGDRGAMTKLKEARKAELKGD